MARPAPSPMPKSLLHLALEPHTHQFIARKMESGLHPAYIASPQDLTPIGSQLAIVILFHFHSRVNLKWHILVRQTTDSTKGKKDAWHAKPSQQKAICNFDILLVI